DQLIKKCVVNESFASEQLMSYLKSKGYFIILEVTAGSEEAVESSVERVSNIIKYADMLRISGIQMVKSFNWAEEVKKVAESKKIKIDICPSDRLYMATSIALQAVMGGVGSVTLTFAGAGVDKGFGAIEELLAAVQVLSGDSDDLRLRTLPEAVKHFKKISGMSIRPTKPVIGKNIFMYESGIHADGIEKNPETYEPFRPDMVGQKRQLAIGKHSGSRSVIYKLKEMGIECRKDEAEKLLRWIREKSIREGRNLSGAEVMRLYKKHVKGA
ncbi:MAG TPA: citramalate synthase, partial [Clostridia bacterium]